MNIRFNRTKKIKFNLLYTCIGLLLIIISNTCFAVTVVIKPNTIISTSVNYSGVTLDMTYGSFIIKNKATLKIENCVVVGTLSSINPQLITVDIGKLELINNKFNINASNIPPHPTTQSLHYVIQIAQGSVNMNNNIFSIKQPFTVGLLVTSASIPTTGFNITNNTFENFHGVLYLIATDNALISGNTFLTNTYGNLVNIGNNSQIIKNKIFFSGNNHLGNSMDIIDSENITISQNELYTPTCHGIYVLNGHDIIIDGNKIFGGITYAMNILSYPETVLSDDYVKNILFSHTMKNLISNNITIKNNFMSQNRYGIAASDVDGLTVKDNIFIQRFVNNNSRIFWTNNATLLQNISNSVWANNLYKEAYTQDSIGDNSNSLNFVPFPATGGVSL